jgi:hypothetical protein
MAGQAARPRPNKNKDGQDKKPVPTMHRDISISPAKPEPAPAPPPAPGAPAPGATNPLTHPNHPVMQSQLGTQTPQPGTPPMGPSAAPGDQRQVQERIQFKDLPAPAQNQVEQQQGIDPYAPIHMAQQSMQGALAQGPSSGPVPNQMAGPFLPPDTQSFPDDMAHLTTLMQQGMAPGSSDQEHQYALNAHALHNAFSQAQQGAGAPAAMPPMSPQAPPAPGAMPTGLGTPPQAPGAPGGIPPELIAALLAQHKRPGAMR